MALNQAQRKHIRARLQEIYTAKQREITQKQPRMGRYSMEAARLAEKARDALNERLAPLGVVLPRTVPMHDIVCAEMDEYNAAVQGAEDAYNNKLKELKAMHDQAIDEVMFGEYAGVFHEVIERLSNFNTD